MTQLLAACGGGGETSSQESGSTDEASGAARIVGGEYFFRGARRLPAGLTTFTFENVGKEKHEMKIYRVTEGTTLKQALAAWGHGGTTTFIGKTRQVGPREKASLTRVLRPGDYMVACSVKTPRGRYHFYEGMLSTFRVPA